MKLIIFYVVTQFLVTFANYYFMTHETYSNARLNTTIISWLRIAGNNATIMQQCRRKCAAVRECKAYSIELTEGQTSLGKFNCSIFDINSCDWQKTSLQNSTTVSKLWEKVYATDLKARPCADRCGVKYRGDCIRCGKTIGWSGLDCETPPQSCLDIPSSNSTSIGNLIWPWGIDARNVTVFCMNGTTLMFRTSYDNMSSSFRLQRLGANLPSLTRNGLLLHLHIRLLDWPLISAVQSLSREKKLIVEISLDGVVHLYNFTNVEISPRGELTMTNTANTTAFPPSLYKAILVIPTTANATCGPFWLFSSNASNDTICSQRTQLMNLGPFLWDGIQASNQSSAAFYSV